jgi:hypothetical protein
VPDMSPHVQWTPFLLSEVLPTHDAYVCLERPRRALPLLVLLEIKDTHRPCGGPMLSGTALP